MLVKINTTLGYKQRPRCKYEQKLNQFLLVAFKSPIAPVHSVSSVFTGLF